MVYTFELARDGYQAPLRNGLSIPFANCGRPSVREVGPESHGVDSLSEVCRKYWQIISIHARRKGLEDDLARDATQAFFMDFFQKDRLSRLEPSMDRFRSFLLKSFDNHLHNEWRRSMAQKRGGGMPTCPIDPTNETGACVDPVDGSDPAQECDRHYTLAVLDEMVARVQGAWEREGRGELCGELLPHLWGDTEAVPCAELGVRFAFSAGNIRVMLHRFRSYCRSVLISIVAEKLHSEGDLESELRHLFLSLGK